MNGIQVKNLVKTYITQSTDIILNGAKRPSTTRTVLHGVSVDFPAGKLTAILGRSGCGKSTLLRLIDGTKDAPDSGEIVMPEGWRCALLSPDPYVITWTSVERNVAMAAGAGYQGVEKMKYITLIRFTSIFFYTVTVFIFIKNESDYLLIPLLQSLGWLLSGVISFFMLIRVEKISLFVPTIESIRRYFKESVPFFVSRVSVVINASMAKTICGIFFSMHEVAVFDLA